MPVTALRNWWDTADLRQRIWFIITVFLSIAVAALFVTVQQLKGDLNDLDGKLTDVQTFVTNASAARNHEHGDQLNVDCEIVHKLGIYVQLCNDSTTTPPTTTTTTTAPP